MKKVNIKIKNLLTKQRRFAIIVKSLVSDNKEHWQLNSNTTLKNSLKIFDSFKRIELRIVQKNTNFKTVKSVTTNLFVEDISQFRLVRIQTSFNMRVRSWLRMNAGGVLNTCKSNGFKWKLAFIWISGGRVSNAWVTCLVLGDNSWKRLLIPHKRTEPHGSVWKTEVVQDGPASD